MLIKILCLNFNSVTGKFDDSELVNFIKDNDIISSSEYFFTRNDSPYIALVMKYNPSDENIYHKNKNTEQYDTSWKELLSESDMGLFNMLRDWRGKTSRKYGLPPFILFTNKQLAMIVKTRPQSKSELLKIDGVGNAKVDKYGEEILSITKISTPEM
jgi:superfamily II DNA helicase RecQ